MNLKRLVPISLISLSLSLFMPIANADTNPFPGVAFGAEIPGLSKIITCTDTPQIPDDCVKKGGGQTICPAGAANDITPTLRADGSWASLKSWCRNSWTPPTSAADDADFRNRQQLATAAATLESQAYSASHPGEQKCVTWGPIVHANGISIASGGVCANVIGTRPDGSTGQVPPTQSGSTSSGSTSSGSTSSGTSDTRTSTSNTTTPATLQVDLTQFGVGKPFTRVVSGRVSVSSCPSGFQAAVNNLDGISSNGATECWPTDAWAAYSVGGTTWSNFKSGNISQVAQQAALTSIEINKVKAIALNRAQQDANLNIGKTMCVQWAFGQQSGQECAYIPIQGNNPLSGTRTDTKTATTSTTDTKTATTSTTETKTATVVVQTSKDSITAITQQNFVGTVAQVKQAVTSMVEDTITAKAISAVLQKVSDLSKVTIKSSAKLPTSKGLDISAASNSASICTVSNTKITVKKTGTCKLEYSVTDSNDNTFLINTNIKVKK